MQIDIQEHHVARIISATWYENTGDERLAELVGEAEKTAAVIAAREKLDEARKRVEYLKGRQSAINARACELNRTLASMRESLKKSIIEGLDIADDALAAHNAKHNLADGASRALETIVGELLPVAENEIVGRESEYHHALAGALLEIANRLGAKAVELGALIADLLGAFELDLRQSVLIGLLMRRRHELYTLAGQGDKAYKHTREYLAQKDGK
jgi:hypothetical protein